MKIKLALLFLMCIVYSTFSLGANNCAKNEELRFQDGTIGCASEYKLFTVKLKSAPEGILKLIPTDLSTTPGSYQAFQVNSQFSIAANKNYARCPIENITWYSGSRNIPSARFALNQCDTKLKERALEKNLNASDCGCEVIYEASVNGPNVPFSKNQFAEKVQLWLSFLQDYPSLRNQFTQEEFDSNKRFYAEYKNRMQVTGVVAKPPENNPHIALGNTVTQNSSANDKNKIGSCSFKTQIKLNDGSLDCLDDYPIASHIPKGETTKLIDQVSRSAYYVISQSKSSQCIAVRSRASLGGQIGTTSVEAKNEDLRIEALADCKAQGCDDCMITVRDGYALVAKNIIIGSNTSRANNSQNSIQSPPNSEQKVQLLNDEKGRLDLARLEQQKDREQKLAEEKRVKEELAKIAQQDREQKELALKQKKDAELQALAEKERKLAEEKRLQMEMAEKLKTEREQKLAEEKRVKEELAKIAQQDREQKELAQKQKKEAELQALSASQASKSAFIGKRLALVIGNAKYSVHPLDNPKNDADDISKALKGAGFEVIDVRDATLSQMRSAIRSFGDRLLNNDVGLVYYSGHGIEIKGRNYFIPVNADIKRSDEIVDQSIDVGLILDKMETAQKPVNILIVDACRDDPFGRSFRSGSRGLATMDAPQGTIIAFATSPGKVAADGDGRNSPYTKNLVLAMQEPNIPIEQVFKKVRRAVQQETKNQQTPWENTSLSGDFYFKVQR